MPPHPPTSARPASAAAFKRQPPQQQQQANNNSNTQAQTQSPVKPSSSSSTTPVPTSSPAPSPPSSSRPSSRPQSAYKTPLRASRPASAPSSHRRSSSTHSSSSSNNPIWIKLSTPRPPPPNAVSASFDDIKHCTFKPTISNNAKQLKAPPFMERVPGYIARFNELHNKVYEQNPQIFVFKPQLNKGKTAELPNRGSFLARYYDDLAVRERKLADLHSRTLFAFQPVISQATQRRTAKIITPFLQRLEEDLEKREEHDRERRRQAESLPYTFTPNTTKHGSFSSFLSRMQNDIQDKQAKRSSDTRAKSPTSARRRKRHDSDDDDDDDEE